MKKFYILLLTLPLIFLAILYFSLWSAITAMGVVLVFIAYRFYAERLEAADTRNKVLETDLEDLHIRLEQSVLKEQKTNKEVGQMRQSKQQLLSVLSHEIRTPMNGVMGMTLLLADTSLTTEQQEYLNTIHRCSESLLTTVNTLLVNDILDFSKMQQEGGQLEYKTFELRDCVEEVLELFADKAGKSGIDILYYIAEDVPVQIIGDSKRLKQLLVNLVENAVKFTPAGEVFVNIQSLPNERPGNPPYLLIEVKDTGIGIPDYQLKQLFKGIPAKEMQKANEKADPGLGLVICKKLAEFMGGDIGVTSREGKGSTFTVKIPMTPGLKPAHYQTQQEDLSHAAGKRVLIIDDNATLCNILVQQMKTWKMVPFSANNPEQAIEILTVQKGVDLMIIDLNMQGTDGWELAASIRKQYPHMPIIGLNVPGDLRHEQRHPVFSSIITKPIRQRILRDKLLGAFGSPSVLNENSMSEIFAMQYPLRILVAEDNAVNQKIALKILERLGYEAALANDGKEVMEMVGTEHYDIILMDVQMPEMNGLEATRMIRTCLEIQPVVIAVTANAMQGDRDECMQAGMDDYISKPIELEELVTRLEKWALVIRERRKRSA